MDPVQRASDDQRGRLCRGIVLKTLPERDYELRSRVGHGGTRDERRCHWSVQGDQRPSNVVLSHQPLRAVCSDADLGDDVVATEPDDRVVRLLDDDWFVCLETVVTPDVDRRPACTFPPPLCRPPSL